MSTACSSCPRKVTCTCLPPIITEQFTLQGASPKTGAGAGTELAERANVNQALISRLESKISASTNTEALKRLATVLACTTDYLVGMHDEEKDSEFLPTAVAEVGA